MDEKMSTVKSTMQMKHKSTPTLVKSNPLEAISKMMDRLENLERAILEWDEDYSSQES